MYKEISHRLEIKVLFSVFDFILQIWGGIVGEILSAARLSLEGLGRKECQKLKKKPTKMLLQFFLYPLDTLNSHLSFSFILCASLQYRAEKSFPDFIEISLDFWEFTT